jgi:hypothetical protein
MSLKSLTERLEAIEAMQSPPAPPSFVVLFEGRPISPEDQAKIDAGANVMTVVFVKPDPRIDDE